MLLDELLPAFDVRTQHVIRVDAPSRHVYASLWSTNFDHWGVTRTLTRYERCRRWRWRR